MAKKNKPQTKEIVTAMDMVMSKAELMRRLRIPSGYEISDLKFHDGCKVSYHIYRIIDEPMYDEDIDH